MRGAEAAMLALFLLAAGCAAPAADVGSLAAAGPVPGPAETRTVQFTTVITRACGEPLPVLLPDGCFWGRGPGSGSDSFRAHAPEDGIAEVRVQAWWNVTAGDVRQMDVCLCSPEGTNATAQGPNGLDLLLPVDQNVGYSVVVEPAAEPGAFARLELHVVATVPMAPAN